VGSSNQNETRNEHRHRDMPPLGPMQFFKTCFCGRNCGLGVLFAGIRVCAGTSESSFARVQTALAHIVPSFIYILPLSLLHNVRGHTEVGSWKPASPRAIQSAPSSSAPAGGEVDEVASVSTDL